MNQSMIPVTGTRFYTFSWIALIFILSYACDKTNIMPDDEFEGTEMEIAALQQTSADLYEITSKDFDKSNFVISPLSIQLALYMVYNGAEGETRKEIGELLNVGEENLETLNKRVKSLMDYFSGLVDEGHLDIHNAVFYDENRVELAEMFIEHLKEYFNVHQENLDFENASAVASINEWVREKTYDKIQEVIQEISDQEVLFLINALYLKADWVNGFATESTSDRPFTTINGEEVMIPTMHRTFGVEHINRDGYQIARMALADSALFTYLIMPEQSGDLSKVIQSDVVKAIWNDDLQLENARVSFSMPVIETKTHVPLNGPLQSLGMVNAFNPQSADLGSMGTSKIGPSLFISRVLHDVYLKMDEKGVEGAAVTTIGVGTTSLPPSLNFDRPFLYMIVDHELGIPVFIGQFTGVETKG